MHAVGPANARADASPNAKDKATTPAISIRVWGGIGTHFDGRQVQRVRQQPYETSMFARRGLHKTRAEARRDALRQRARVCRADAGFGDAFGHFVPAFNVETFGSKDLPVAECDFCDVTAFPAKYNRH